jgi:hypothetical protein
MQISRLKLDFGRVSFGIAYNKPIYEVRTKLLIKYRYEKNE